MKSYFASDMTDMVGERRYMAGKPRHIAGVVAQKDKLTIRLIAPSGDFLSRIGLTGFCPVPPNTPIKPNLRVPIPSAGPYYVSSYAPGQGVVLARNPNYHGSRPRHFARIQLSVGIPASRAVHMIETGSADFTTLSGDFYPSTPMIQDLVTQLAARYGAGSGQPQYVVTPTLALDYLALNTHRGLFADVRLRQAVNYAIDRHALADIGTPGFQPLREPPTDHYLPPGMPGYRAASVYPDRPDPARARQLVESAHASGRTAVLYTLNNPPGPKVAQIVKNNLDAIGIRVDIRAFPTDRLFSRLARPGEPFDLSYAGWYADHPDPSQMLNWLLDGSAGIPSLNDPGYQRRLAAAAQLSGPQRYLTYGALDLDLARNAAPLAAYGNSSSHDFFSARIGCKTFGVYGMDLAALCIKAPHHR
jgi:peptide/nickel transport system substrate-binding protein